MTVTKNDHLKTRVAKLEKKSLAFMEDLRRKDQEHFEKVARTFIAQAETFKTKDKGRVQ